LPSLSKSKVKPSSNVFREIELRENLVGTGFINPPDEKSDFNNRVTITGKPFVLSLNSLGEIASTIGFDAEKQ
jgi:hypothetical protein